MNNSYRSNEAGRVVATAATDMTTRSVRVECEGATVSALAAEICNRGLRAAPEGAVVRFTVDAETVCEARTDDALLPGECFEVSCAPTPAAITGQAVTATASADRRMPECGDFESNAARPVIVDCE